jgi:hypothetical protein
MSGPVFYRWPIMPRFELGGRDNLSTVYARAAALYKAAFAPDDNCVIAAGRFKRRIPPLRIPAAKPRGPGRRTP